MLSLVLFGYQLKCCSSSRWWFNVNMVGMQKSVIDEAIDQWCNGSRPTWKLMEGALNTYCQYLNFLPVLWFDFQFTSFFVWTFHSLLRILVRLASSCYKLLLMCLKQFWRKIMYVFLVIVLLCKLTNYYQNRFMIRKIIVRQEGGEMFWDTVYKCVKS